MKPWAAAPAFFALHAHPGWGARDKWGIAVSSLDPVEVLRIAKAPSVVIDAVTAAKQDGIRVEFQSYSCNLGGWSSIVIYWPVSSTVQAMLDAIDASGITDGSLMGPVRGRRWHKPETNRGVPGYWEWVLDGD